MSYKHFVITGCLWAVLIVFAGQAQAAHHDKTGSAPMLAVDPGSAESVPVTHAIAVMQPTEGNDAAGTAEFSTAEGGDGLMVKAKVENLPAGTHGYHVHLYGDCSSADAKSAGTHFNFKGSSENPPKDTKRITGNLGDLEAGDDGTASAETMIEHARLQGTYSIIGRSVIIHEKGNDPQSPPIGAAGSRLACGVIGIAQ
jgi:Cu-Zn family superoxide dismutase